MNFLEKRKCRKLLKDVDYQFAAMNLVERFNNGVIEKQLAELFDSYLVDPCFETAIKIIDRSPGFLFFFSECKPGGIYFIQHEVRTMKRE